MPSRPARAATPSLTSDWTALGGTVARHATRLVPNGTLAAALAPLVEHLAGATGAWRVSLQAVHPETGALRLVAAHGLAGARPAPSPGRRPRSVSEWVLAERRGVTLQGEVRDERFEGSGDAGLEASLCVPVLGESGPVGVLSLARRAPAPPFGEDDVAAATAAVAPLAAALVRRWRSEAALAGLAALESGAGTPAQLPEGLLEVRGYELGLARRRGVVPAFDVCDRAGHADGSLSLLVADVPGRGAPAACAAAFVQGVFAAAAAPERSTAGVAAHLATRIEERLGPARSTALWVAHLGRTGEMTACAAGHRAPLWVPADGGPAIALERGGPPAGSLTPARYEEETLRLLPGDLVVVVSDGAYSAAEAGGRPLDGAPLADWLDERRRLPADRIAAELVDEACRRAGRAHPPDDAQALVVRFRPDP